MANFDLSTASKAIPEFDGKYKDLPKFLIVAELIDKTLSDSGKLDLLQYLLYINLNDSVRTALKRKSVPEKFCYIQNTFRNIL